MRFQWRRSFLVVLVIAAAFALGAQVQDQLGISFSLEGLVGFQQWVADLGWLGPIVFVTLVTFRIFVGLSSHVVLILGGLAFGAVGGIVWGSLGLLASALLVFFAARQLGDDWVRPRLGNRYAALSARIERLGAGAIFAITAHPVGPLTPVSLAAGLVGLPLWEFTLAVALAAPIRAAIFSFLGTAVLNLSLAELVAIGVGLVGVFALPFLIPSVRAWVSGVDEDAYRSYPGPAAWRADELAESDWLSDFTPAHQAELDAAARSLPADYDQWIDLKREDVPLPRLGPLLDAVNQELEWGKGFAILRGLNLSADDVDYAYRVNWVLALNLGQVICQNANGEVIGAVQALVTSEPTADTRGYISNAELRFHCDGGDVASLLCVRQAPDGGSNSLVSSVSVHNAMVEECPDHLQALYKGLPMYMRKEGDALESSELPRQPLYMPQEESLLCWSNLKLMELSYETAGISMPEEERAALDAFEAIAERPEHKLSLKLQPGDLLLTHNFVCMHKRAGFTDDPDPAKSRLMLRLWYNIADGRANAVQSPEGRKGYFTQSPPVITAMS